MDKLYTYWFLNEIETAATQTKGLMEIFVTPLLHSYMCHLEVSTQFCDKEYIAMLPLQYRVFISNKCKFVNYRILQ